MGSSTLQLCFGVYADVEENSYVSVEEVSEFLRRHRSYVSVNMLLWRKMFLQRRYRSYLEGKSFRFVRPPSLTLTPP